MGSSDKVRFRADGGRYVLAQGYLALYKRTISGGYVYVVGEVRKRDKECVDF